MIEPSTLLNRLEDDLRRWGRYLVSADEHPLLISAILPYLPDFSWICIWKRDAPNRYILKYSTLDNNQLTDALQREMNAAVNSTYRGSIVRTNQALSINTELREISTTLLSKEIQVATTGITAKSVSLVTSSNGQTLLEIYTRTADTAKHLISPRTVIDSFYKIRTEAQKEYELADPHPEIALYQERELFDVMLHDIKMWLGKELGSANLFLYEARERMLYHRATTSLRLNPEAVLAYKAVPQVLNAELLNHVHTNIDALDGVDDETKEQLRILLNKLADTEEIRSHALEFENNLRLLLTVLPQEPGTGVAGHSAVTLIPEICNSEIEGSDKWSAEKYPTEWFALMLSVEKMFGIGAYGSMAAVPLMESGQLAGVLFVVREDPFSYEKDIPIIMEKAAHISPLLTMYRSRKFQHALMAGASSDSSALIAHLAAVNAPIAFNSLLAVVWHLSAGKIETISTWGFSSLYSRYGMLVNYDPNRDLWRREVGLKSQIHSWSKTRKLQVVKRSNIGTPKWGLPTAYTEQYEKLMKRMLNSGVVCFPPSSEDVLVMYFAEDASVIEANLGTIAQKLFALYSVERLRENPKEDFPEIIGESPQIKKAIRMLMLAAKNKRRTMLQGPTGSGKSLFAQHFHRLSGRQGDIRILRASEVPDTLQQDALFGHMKGAFVGANSDEPGLIELANGGTLFIDDFDTASEETQEMLLGVVETGIVKRLVNAKEKRVDFLLITATNHTDEELLKKVRKDLVSRFADKIIKIPSLEERRMDIPLLVRKELASPNVPPKILESRAWLKLINAKWPLGVRTIKSVAQDLIELDSEIVQAEDIEPRFGFEPTDEQCPIELMDVSQHLALQDGCPPFKVEIFLDCHTYRPNKNPREDWGNLAARAFKVLAQNAENSKEINTYFSMGCGAGLDAIAAMLTFNCERVIVADVHPEVVAFARENLLLNCPTLTLEKIERYETDLFSNIPEDTIQADLIYENLPNLIPKENERSILGSSFKSASYLHKRRAEIVPENFKGNLLELHYAFLSRAKKYLTKNGSVVCSIGARVNWGLIEQMFSELGYSLNLLVFDFKEQEEAEEVVSGYAEMEQESAVEGFRFYPAEEARKLLNSLSSTRSLSGFADSRVDVEEALKQIQMSASRAKEFINSGGKIGHMVYLVQGTPIV